MQSESCFSDSFRILSTDKSEKLCVLISLRLCVSAREYSVSRRAAETQRDKEQLLIITDLGEGIFMYPFQGMIFIICQSARGGASLTPGLSHIALSGQKFSPRRGLTCQPGVSEAPPPVMN